MALFNKTTEEKKETAPEKVAPVIKKGTKKELVVRESPLAAKLLMRPRITEKAYALGTFNQYVFEVARTATKKSVKRAVEEAYGVTVESINIVRLPAKKRLSGKNRTVGFKGSIKKAIVSVVKGQTIALFKGGI